MARLQDLPVPSRMQASLAGVGVGAAGLASWAVRRGRENRLLEADSLRSAAARLTTPLLPDDYLRFINPLWTAREVRGKVHKVVKETEDAATLVIKPGWGWSFEGVEAGQYVGIGVQVDGRWHWRSYSLTSAPKKDQKHIAITIKAMPEGFISQHLVNGLEPGTLVRLALPQGEFVLPDPPPAKLLFLTGGSGITPTIGMLRTMERRGTLSDVRHVHTAPTIEGVLFRDELQELEQERDSYRLHLHPSDEKGILTLDQLDELCPDWRERDAWVCGPGPMLDSAEEHWEKAGLEDSLHIERFSVDLGGEAEGGHVTFSVSGKDVDVDGATTLMQAGEDAGIQMPFGCRMGICHTCVVPLESGAVRDLRSGQETSGKGARVQTCVTAAAGDCVLQV